MDRIWLASYPSGVPADIDADAYRSLLDVFNASVEKHAGRAAYAQLGATLSYAEVERLSRAFAAFLSVELALEKGARVALMMPNILQYPVALFGALRAGCVVVNCSPLYTDLELERQLADSGAEAVVVLENFAATLQRALPGTRVRHVVVTQFGDLLGWLKGPLVNFYVKHIKRLAPRWRIAHAVGFTRALRIGAQKSFKDAALSPQDIAFLQYTGGTTGVPKGAVLTHRNLVANLEQQHAFMRDVLQEGRDIVVTPLPLFHIYGLTLSCLLPFKIGATNVLIANPRDIGGLVKELRKYRFTCLAGVNTLFKALLDHQGFARLDFSALRAAACGGAALEERVARRWKETTGTTLIEAYGLTETSPVVTCNPFTLREFNGACGLPVPSTEIALRDVDGADLPPGVAGELCVRGPQVMRGYWNRPDETAKVLTADGFLRTGDIATIDEKGFLRIVDRAKDMINVSGLKVYPSEVEAVAAMHPGVVEAAAIGAGDVVSGETVKLIVVSRDPSLTAAALKAHCRKYLAPYKVPRIVEFRASLPKTALGKVLRRGLKEDAA